MSREAYAEFQHEAEQDRRTYAHPRARVRFLYKDLRLFGPCGDFRELKFSDKNNAAGGLSMKLPDTEHWREYFYGQPKGAMRPIVVDLPGGYRTLWFTVTFGRIREGRKWWIQVEAVHALEHFNWIRIWPLWWSLPELQPKEHIGIGGSVTVLKEALQGNLFRLQGSLWSIPTGDLFKPSTWNLARNALWPMMVNPRRMGFRDASKWTTIACRMDAFMDIAQDVCKSENISMTVDIVFPDEDPQPFPELYHLDRPTIIFDFVEKGSRFAFSGTIVDGFLRTVHEMVEDALAWITYPILGDKGWEAYQQKKEGTLRGLPIAVYRTGKWSTTNRVEQTTHIPMASRVTGGGKSPGWINDLVVNAGNAITGWIGLAIGFPGLQLGVLTDQLRNTVMAFHSQEDLARANEAGPTRFKEAFVESQGTGLSLNTFAAMQAKHHEVRGYTSQSIDVSNGAPYFVGRDVNKGDPIGYELPDGTVHVDHIESIDYEETPTTRRLSLQIGSGEAEREPGAIALGKFRKLASTITRVALGG
ncbi:Gp37-like protein [Rhodococcus sp. UNC363MFTsu5.1]|uniref:Gp37-like protein n=1 Tax=Rhodococcus sp. UNC363MFTsu5.1 TaxID=1449069 RepID=UPI0004876740|nr:hypothetical protein [Rhodococcus sp. UNC363MFTsu5.1]